MQRSAVVARFALLALLVAPLVAPSRASASGCSDPAILGTENQIVMGATQRHVEAADLNGDGLLDLVASTDNAIVVALATGMSGGIVSYGAGVAYPTPQGATGTAIADFNGDGILDIAVACDNAGLVLFRGLGSGGVGNGQFISYSNINIGSAWDVAAGDLNGDGILDLVVSLRNGTVVPFIGHGSGGVGDGTFTQGVAASAPGSPKGLVLADLDKDGILDVVVATEGPAVGVLKGNGSGGIGNGTFQSGISLIGSGTTYDVAVGDFNRDGYPDVASANYTGQSISVFLGGPGMTFGSALTHAAPGSPLGIAAADIDSDGRTDLVVAATGGGSSFAYFHNVGNSAPTLDGFNFSTTYGPAKVGYGISVADLNGDHAVDVLVPGVADPSVLLAFNACTAFPPRALTTDVVGSGTISRNPDLPFYTNGTAVQLTATPAPGWVFANWSGDALGSNNPTSVTMDADRTVTARFELDPTLPPQIVSITDVPLDQGGKVKLRWRASALETNTSDPDSLVTQYYIWREIPQSALRAYATDGASGYLHTTSATRDYFWEFVTSLPASGFTGYSYTASTTSDSTELGNPYTSFLVQGRNAAGTRWFNSDPDSGYSVDNLAPTTPGPVAASYGAASNQLHWGASVAPDLRGYRLYGGTTSDFVPSAVNLIAEVADTAFVDPSPRPFYYRLAAIDVHGNMSGFVLVSPDAQLGVPAGDLVFALDGMIPNPSTGDHISIQLSLPSTEPALLELLDVSGRRLAGRRLEGVAGRQTVALDPGKALAPGLYWIRLRHAGEEKTARAVVMQ